MAKFKVGDRVFFTGLGGRAGLTGRVIEAGGDVPSGELLIDVDPGQPYDAPRVARFPEEVERIVTTKPKTIPARNLSGKHIGRVVTITTKSGAVVTDELSMVGHSGDGVTAILKSVSPEGSFVRGQGFDIDPDSEVIVNA